MIKQLLIYMSLLPLCLLPVHGQAWQREALFTQVDTLSLETGSHTRMEWADLDHDGLQDLIVSGTDTLGTDYLTCYSQADSLVFRTIPIELPILRHLRFTIGDANNDLYQDILINGVDSTGAAVSLLLHNQEGNSFEVEQLSLAPLSQGGLLLHDLNKDGLRDIVLTGINNSGTPGTNLYLQQNEGWQEAAHPFPALWQGEVVAYGVDNASQDLLFTGLNASGQPQTALFLQDEQVYWQADSLSQLDPLYQTSVSWADLNRDSRPDLLLSGLDQSGAPRLLLYHWLTDRYVLQATRLPQVAQGHHKLADFSGDGLADVLLSGTDAQGTVQAAIWIADSSGDLSHSLSLPGLNAAWFAPIQYDGDGHLDFLMAGTDSVASPQLQFYLNEQVDTNAAPGLVSTVQALAWGDEVRFVWLQTTDDRTDSASITYDVLIRNMTTTEYVYTGQVGEGCERLGQKQGSLGSDQVLSLTGLEEGTYHFCITSIDNALHSAGCGDLVCKPCFELTTEVREACLDQELQLEARDGALTDWYSFERGFLGQATQLSYLVTGPDRIYANQPGQSLDCDNSYSIEIIVAEPEQFEPNELTYCPGDSLTLNSPAGWSAVVWQLEGQSVEADSIRFVPIGQASIGITAFDANQCPVSDSILLRPDPIQLVARGGGSIRYDQSTLLEAAGAQQYQWAPNDGLSAPLEAVTEAQPLRSRQYTVTGTTDSGCRDTASVFVTVLHDLFVPALFTPNGDGRNDRLLVYGGNFNDLVFSVYSRDGEELYRAEGPEATQLGWDGTYQGDLLPNGTYLWTIEGSFADGSSLRIEGKNRGTVELAR